MVAAKNSKLLWLRILQERKKREKMNTLITYITLRRRRLRNLLFLLLQNKALSQSYDRIRSHHKRSCRWYLRNSGWFSNVWENYSDERFKTIFRVSRETFTNILSFIRDGLQKARNLSAPAGSWRLLTSYIRANRPWDSDGKKYDSRSIKCYCN